MADQVRHDAKDEGRETPSLERISELVADAKGVKYISPKKFLKFTHLFPDTLLFVCNFKMR